MTNGWIGATGGEVRDCAADYSRTHARAWCAGNENGGRGRRLTMCLCCLHRADEALRVLDAAGTRDSQRGTEERDGICDTVKHGSLLISR